MKEPMLKTTKKTKVVVLDKKPTGALTLDQIEKQLDELAQRDCHSLIESALLESKMKRLEASANYKLKRLQLKALEESNEAIEAQPIEVKFITSKTPEQLERVKRIENQVKDGRTIKQDA